MSGRNITAGALIAITAFGLVGCSAPAPAPAPTVTVTTKVTPTEAPATTAAGDSGSSNAKARELAAKIRVDGSSFWQSKTDDQIFVLGDFVCGSFDMQTQPGEAMNSIGEFMIQQGITTSDAAIAVLDSVRVLCPKHMPDVTGN